MKKIILSLSALVLTFAVVVSTLKVKAANAPVLEDGAQIRIDEYAGMRFIASAEAIDGAKYGFVLAKGDVANPTVETEDSVKAETNGLKEDGTYCVTITDFREEVYTQDISVRAYVVVDGVYTYSETTVVRNLAEVASFAANGSTGEFVEAVNNYINANYMKTFTDTQGQLHIDNAIYESNTKNLKKVFIEDWNNLFGTTLDANNAFIGGSSSPWYKAAKTSSQTDWTGSKLKEFFQDSTMYAKWGWLFNYINSELTNGTGYSFVKAQIAAIVNNTADTANWYYGAHLSSFIMSIMEGAYQSSGWGSYSFEKNPAKLGALINYNNKVYATNQEFVLKGESISLENKSKTGYTFNGYSDGSEVYVSEYAVTSTNVLLVESYTPITYNIKFYNGSTELTDLATTYNVESNITLPTFEVEGFDFGGWYENSNLTGDAVSSIAAGTTGNKVYYAKIIEKQYKNVTVNYDLNGGYFAYNSLDEAIADFLNDYNAARGKSHTVESFYELGSWGEISDASLFLYNANYKAKWTWLVNYIATVAGSANKSAYQNFYNYNSQSELNAANGNYIYSVAYELRGWVAKAQYTKNANFKTADYASLITSSTTAAKGQTEYVYCEPCDLLVPTRTGYIFTGWTSSIDGSVVSTFPGYLDNPGTITYTANWKVDTEINVTFNLNDGFWNDANIILSNMTGTPVQTISIVRNTGNYYGYYTEGVLFSPISSAPASSTTRYAHRIGIQKVDGVYKIVQVVKSGETTAYIDEVEYLIYTAESTGGFNVTKAVVGDVIVFDKDIASLAAGTVELTAKQYSEADFNAARFANCTVTVAAPYTLENNVKHGTLQFKGWYDNPEGTGDPLTTITSSMTVYACWSNYIDLSYETVPYVEVESTIKLNASVVGGKVGNIVFESKDTTIALVDQNGVVTGKKVGTVEIYIYDSGDPSVNLTVTISVVSSGLSELFDIISNAHNDQIFTRYNLGIGAGTPVYYSDIYGSVNKILFNDSLVIDKTFANTEVNNATGDYYTMQSLEFITVHYTGNMGVGADAYANAQYFASDNSTSIHYTTGNDGVYQALTHDKGAWHAGDSGSVAEVGYFEWIPTGVAYDGADLLHLEWSASNDFYFEINGKKTSVKIPSTWNYNSRNTDHIFNSDGTISSKSGYGQTAFTNRTPESFFNDMGFAAKVVNGEYYMGKTWWCYTQAYEGRICSTGGNYNSIGIESCVDQGSDLWYTWQKTAQLVAKLLVDNNLDITRVKGHHFYSGKDCPQPMLENNLEIWWEFIDLIEAEYDVLTKLTNYEISFTSNNPQYISDNGRVILVPAKDTKVSYTVTLTDKSTGVSQSVTYFTTIIGTNNK